MGRFAKTRVKGRIPGNTSESPGLLSIVAKSPLRSKPLNERYGLVTTVSQRTTGVFSLE
jgi:hypothetical protein